MRRLFTEHHKSYAIFEKEGKIQYFSGILHRCYLLSDIQKLQLTTKKPVVFLLPFCSIRERGFIAKGTEPILTLEGTSVQTFSREELVEMSSSQEEYSLDKQMTSSLTDEEFSCKVEEVQGKEIAGGNASQVILSRLFEGQFSSMDPLTPLNIFSRLLQQKGQYMTFLFADKSMENSQHHIYFLGATPERHLEIQEKKVLMNPIAGTMKKKCEEGFFERLCAFVTDTKEVHELFQVLDEELKMMAKICPGGGEIQGPFLRETGAVIHTEYLLKGERAKQQELSSIDALRQTLHAPTLVGSPEESAARIIDTYESSSRRYYGGEIGILHPEDLLDTGIVIRTAELNGEGRVSIRAGAGIVRDSIPEKEAEETRVKSQGMRHVMEGKGSNTMDFLDALNSKEKAHIETLLQERNECLSRFHLDKQMHCEQEESLQGKKITIINNEDDFTSMLGHMVMHMGCEYTVIDVLDYYSAQDDSDLVILGPGPGDVNDQKNRKITALRVLTKKLREKKKPVLGICLGHQALAYSLGFSVKKQKQPYQGMQRKIFINGREELLGFYNSFSPLAKEIPGITTLVDENKRIMMMQGFGIIGCQFHPESVMSKDGYTLLKRFLKDLLKK